MNSSVMCSMEKLKINKKLLPVKVHYFLLNGAHSGVISFIPVYAQQLGISVSAIGITLAVVFCLTILTKTAFGCVADHFQKLKQVLLFLILIDVAANLGLNFIPKPHQTPVDTTSDNFFCYRSNLYIIDNTGESCTFDYENSTNFCSISCFLCEEQSKLCFDESNFTASSFRSSANKNTNFTKITDSAAINLECLNDNETICTDSCFDGSTKCKVISDTNPPLQLWLLSFLVGIVYIANGSIVSLSDSACYNALNDQPQNFGKQRMWGTIGWGLFSLLTGYLNQVLTGKSNIYSYSAGFYMVVVLFTIDLLFITKLQLEDATVSKSIFNDVGILLIKPRILLFVLATFGIGIVTGISRSYLFWYLRTILGANQLVLGCLSAIQCFFGELPFFFFAGLIINKLGHINTFTMSFLAYGLKFVIYSFLTNPWWSLLVDLLQGPCFGSFYSAMTSYAKLISPTGTEATVQGIVSGTFEGLGFAAGSLLAGFCLKNFDSRTAFYWIGMASLISAAIHWTIYLLIDNKKTATFKLQKK